MGCRNDVTTIGRAAGAHILLVGTHDLIIIGGLRLMQDVVDLPYCHVHASNIV